MGLNNIISDFDGTLTDSEASLGEFFPAYHEMFARELGVNQQQYLNALQLVEEELQADPSSGWEINGYIVAPINSDPFALNTASHMGLLKAIRDGRFAKLKTDFLPRNDVVAGNLTDLCHRTAYKEKQIIFRQGALPFVVSSSQSYEHFNIVSNSGTEDIEKALDGNCLIKVPVIGMAKKYVPTPDFNEVPMYVELPDFPRPVFLRRGLYNKVLTENVENPLEAGVLGDNFELDLALPMHLGFAGVLLDTPAAQAHEIAYVQSHPNGFFAKNYEQAAEFFASRR